MKKQTSLLTSILMIGLLAMFSACGKSGSNNGKAVQPVNVRIEVVAPQQMVDDIQVAGTVKALEDVNMSPEEGGW